MSLPTTDMNALLTYGADFAKNERGGTLASFPDPPEPPDIGTPFTQDQIDFLKRMITEMQLRFNSESGPGPAPALKPKK